jgi:hypothetical protein
MSLAPERLDSVLLEANRSFYDGLWSGARLVAPERFNTWPLVRSLLAPQQRRLEVAPGLRPRLPLAGTHFVDISAPARAPCARAAWMRCWRKSTRCRLAPRPSIWCAHWI